MSPIAGIPGAVRPIPNEITSVAPEWRRYFLLSFSIAARPTNVTEIIAFLMFSFESVASMSSRTFAGEIPGRRTVEETSVTTLGAVIC